MADSQSLGVDYFVIKDRMGRLLGHPEDDANWQQHHWTALKYAMQDGMRQFYQPPEVDQYGAHQWSFMYPVTTITTVIGLMPLAVGGGGMWSSMAYAMMAGLTFSTALRTPFPT